MNEDPGSSLETTAGHSNGDGVNMTRYVYAGYKVDLRRKLDYGLRGLSKS